VFGNWICPNAKGLQSSYCSKCSFECSLEWSHLDECKDFTCEDCQIPQVHIFLRIKFLLVFKGRNTLIYIFSFEKMGAFATLKNMVEFNLIFFSGWQPEKMLGFLRELEACLEKIWVVATLYFFKLLP
jgi:hypothetical protein